jgi:hypothetical protein
MDANAIGFAGDALALQTSLPRARKVDQCFFLFFGFGLVRARETSIARAAVVTFVVNSIVCDAKNVLALHRRLRCWEVENRFRNSRCPRNTA